MKRYNRLTSKLILIMGGIIMLSSNSQAPGQIDYAVQDESVKFEEGEVIYENPLSSPEDIEDWVIESSIEGHPAVTFPHGRMRMESDCHFLLWCPKDFPDNIKVTWEFKPLVDRGLAMFWIAATGKDGKDLFDPELAPREGVYSQYRSGDINALHVAYFRRNPAPEGRDMGEINFQICSLRKSTVHDNGPVMARGADPIPSSLYAVEPYSMEVIKYGRYFRFSINGFRVLEWQDDGEDAPVLENGKIGFRQMRGLIADYANLQVRRVEIKKPDEK